MNIVNKFTSTILFNERAFRFTYVLAAFLASLCFVERSFQTIVYVCMVWAIFLLGYRIKNNYGKENFKFFPFIALFLGSTLCTILYHYRDNLGINFLLFLQAIILIFLFYGLHADDKVDLKQELLQLARILFYLTILFCIGGLIVMFGWIRIKGFGYTIGLNGNRFTGLYTHPNIAAFVSVIGIVCGHLAWKRPHPNKVEKAFCPTCIFILGVLLNLYTVFLSDSNDAMLFLICYTTATLFFYLLRKKKVHYVLIGFLVLLFCAVFSIGIYKARDLSQPITSKVVNQIHYPNAPSNDKALVDIGRPPRVDYTSGRYDTLIKGMKLYKHHPFIGIGKGNIMTYGKTYLDDTFKYFDLHNGFLTILISTGFVGFVLFILFAIQVASYIIKTAFTSHNWESDSTLCILFCSLLSYCIYALFERTLLFDLTFMVTIFWVLLGYAMAMTDYYNKKKES